MKIVKTSASRSTDRLVAIFGILIAAIGLNIGTGAQAGDVPEPHYRWLIGFGLFVSGVMLARAFWLKNKGGES
ncbi:MAG: hypothetical protein KIH63_001540 [Candidatus Saccharibacteria bacterium]|nr:hypothetical protein [Candidatus Saccharibacteria bacterium]